MNVFRRSTFVGTTDKYMQSTAVQSGARDLTNAVAPNSLLTIAGPVANDFRRSNDATRLSGYDEMWRFYHGQQFDVPFDGNLRKYPVNFCKKAVHKRAVWAVGRGLVLESVAGNEWVGDLLLKVWKKSRVNELLRSVVRTSLVTGDAFLYFTVVDTDTTGKQLPKDKQYVRITQLNPAFCFPQWSPTDPGVLAGMLIEFPTTLKNKDGIAEEGTFSIVIKPDTITRYWNGEERSTTRNALGVVNVVHVPNVPEVGNTFGESVVRDLKPINSSWNDIFHSVRKIIHYHGEPATVIYGAKFSDMQKGANKLWSGLPFESKVENLELKGDLGAIYKSLEVLEGQMYHVARTPKICYDSEGLAVSNTSGVAMLLLFQPLIEASIEMQSVLAHAVAQGNEIIAQIHKAVFGEDVRDLADDPDEALNFNVEFLSMAPRDEQAELDMAVKRIEAGIWSRAEAIRRLGGVRDTQRHATELAADGIASLAKAHNEARASRGEAPNLVAALLGSPFISEELLDIASQLPSTAQEIPEPKTPAV